MTRDELLDRLTEHVPADEASKIMDYIDAYAEMLTEEPPEAWTAQQVADFLGYESTAAARTTMSRWGIASIAYVDHPETRRPMALYPAAQVRAERDKRRGPSCETPTSS